jgi:4-amino-4-deoxy-L-arabinose transferase-like glycosyltransferase
MALLAYVKLLRGPDWRWALTFGVALGLGLLAKYAMIYFILCAICAAWIDRDARAFWIRPQSWIALGIAAAIMTPNIYWNIANDLATLRHTGDNISGDGFAFMPWRAAEFLASQFAVAGPLVFAAFVVILIRFRNNTASQADRLMLAFALPPLALVVALSFVRTAHGNWAAPAMPAVTILAVAWWLRTGRWRWLAASLAVGLLVQAVLLVGDANAYRIALPLPGTKSDIYARTLGWRGLGDQVASLARRERTPVVAAEGRAETAALIYYLRNEPVRVTSWPAAKIPAHHFDMTRALDASAGEPVLFVSPCLFGDRLGHYYEDVAFLAPVTIATGPHTTRTHFVFRLSKRRGIIEPLRPCIASPVR